MGFKQNFLKQFGKPTGNFGRFVGWLMSFKNKDRALWTYENLKLKPSDFVLEIGFGPGKTFMKVADNLTTGFIAGIDHSEIMLDQASKRNKKHVDSNTAKIECGTVWDLTYPENYFDSIFGSNVHFFWKNPVDEFKKLVSLLKSNGRLVMVFQPRWTKNEEEVKQVAEQTKKQYEEAGLKNIEIDFKKMKPVTCIHISGQK
ncbi:MAG: class I SAM-dependent methyltransferase [Cyclobacteriaceae bacterium]|nr:class I SAM-dependent methyltransferase [Cyclobacteriaceae bacterium]